jgi:putative ABC transport system permease protein
LLKVALKGLWARKLRTALTGVAVVVGVAFVSGTFIFTDAIDASFKDLFERAQKGTDVSVQARLAVEESFAPPPTMPADTLKRVQAVPGVDEAFGSVSSENGTLLDDKGEPIVSNGPPTIIITAAPARFDAFTYVEGHKAETADEVVIDKATADKYGFGVGDTVTVTVSAPKKDYKVAGVATVGDSENLAGSRLVQMTLDEARRVSGHDGYDDISVAASSGTSPEKLKAAIAAQLPRKEFSVLTGKEQADKSSSDLSEALGFIRIALLVFAGIALLVGGFLIFNTFAVTVAQRSKEFALLRTLGASRAQVLRSVLAETVTIGVLASVIGIAAGMAAAPGLRALLASFGLELGGTTLPLEPRTIIAGFAVGIVATVVSGFVPARRATRVQPLEAMRDAVLPTGTHLRRRRIVVAVLVEIVGLILLSSALFGDLPTTAAVASTMGLGAVVMMFGLALIAPVLVRPMSGVIGRPLERVIGLTGRLARENTRRQPQRTAVTASALMIGLALVVFVTIFAAGLRATIDQGIDDQVRAAGIVKSVSFLPLPDGVAEQLAKVDGVAAVSPIQFETGKLKSDGKNVPITGVDPATVTEALQLEWDQGTTSTIGRLGDRDIVVSETWAKARSLDVGDSLTLITPRGHEIAYKLAGTYNVKVGLVGDVVISNASLDRDWDSRDVAFAMVISDPGTNADELRRAEDKALTGFPTAEAQTIDEFKQEQSDGVGTLVNLIYALLSLSVIVALVGIVNTLALSVHERTRELGMLRAVGMSRWQVRQMIGSESVITAVLGALLGVVLGVVFAGLISVPLADEGFVFELPILTLIGVTVLAAVAGVLAAIAPARRAANVDVLRAVTTE